MEVDDLWKWRLYESEWSMTLDLRKRTASKWKSGRLRAGLSIDLSLFGWKWTVIWNWSDQSLETGRNPTFYAVYLNDRPYWLEWPSSFILALTPESRDRNHVSANPEIINETFHLNKFFTDIWYCWCLLSKHVFHYFSHFFLNFLSDMITNMIFILDGLKYSIIEKGMSHK